MSGILAGADFTNAVLDRVLFDKADLTNAKFNNAVLSGSTFDDANLTGRMMGRTWQAEC